MKDAMVRLYDESNKQNLAIFDELLHPDFVSYGGAGFKDLYGAQAFKELYQSFLATFPDLYFIVDDLIAEGNRCAVRGTLGGTHSGNFMGIAPPTGKKTQWTGIAVFAFDDAGKVTARWQEWDGMAVMQQLGVVPAPGGYQPRAPAPTPPMVVGGRTTSEAENKATFKRFIEEVWNQGNLAMADEIFHPGATSPSAPQLPTGATGVRMIATMFRTAFPDFHMEFLDEPIADGDRIVARFRETGTHLGDLMGMPPTGKKVSFGEIGILRFEGGKVVESWYEVDMLGMMGQLNPPAGSETATPAESGARG
jgi:predicted ester cyclase